jgi:hypothetical protein
MLSSVTTLVRYALSSCPAVAAAPNGGSVPQAELRTFLHQKFPVRLAFRPRVWPVPPICRSQSYDRLGKSY